MSGATARGAVAGGASLLAVLFLCGAQAVEPVATRELKEGPGRDVTIDRCVVCHSLEYIPANAPAMDRATWQKTIQKMKDRFGAPMTDDEAREILDYLAANYAD
jgi:cytochrome c5